MLGFAAVFAAFGLSAFFAELDDCAGCTGTDITAVGAVEHLLAGSGDFAAGWRALVETAFPTFRRCGFAALLAAFHLPALATEGFDSAGGAGVGVGAFFACRCRI